MIATASLGFFFEARGLLEDFDLAVNAQHLRHLLLKSGVSLAGRGRSSSAAIGP
jgi:hypothetical protein